MNRGFYNIASSILTNFKEMNVKSHNMSNVNTVGYKRDQALQGTFEKMMISYNSEKLGDIPTKIGIRDVDTIFTQGGLKDTGRSLDVAIAGDGFFKVQNQDGNTVYTRKGILQVDGSGYLTDDKGNFVLGKNGKIRTFDDNVSISSVGAITYNNQVIDTLDIVGLNNPIKSGGDYYVANGEKDINFTIAQGYLENSNVDLAKEMTEMITIQRHLQSNQRMLLTQDELNKKMISEVGR